MKTHTKISTMAVVCALCASATMTASAAPSVRSLGGAGTYSSASSATQAKSGTTGVTAPSAQKSETVRGGSLSVNSGATPVKNVATSNSGVSTGLRGSSTRSASVRVPSTARLSIGKYLGGSSVSAGLPPRPEPVPEEDVKYYDISYDDRVSELTIYEVDSEGNLDLIMRENIATQDDITEIKNLLIDLETQHNTDISNLEILINAKQDKLNAGGGIEIDDATNTISAAVGSGLKIENGLIVTDIEFPEAPIQKQIKSGDGIDVVEGEEFDTVAVKLATDGGLKFDDDGSLRTAIEIPEVELKEYVEGAGITVEDIAGENKATVKVKLAQDGGLKFDDDGSLRTAIDLPNVPVQEKLTAGTGIKIEDDVISTNLESGSPSNLTIVTDPNTGKQTISVVGLANADGIIEYKQGNGIAISGDNQISANIGSGLRFNEDTKAIETIATLPDAPVQEKLNAGANITIVPDSENQGQMIISATDTTYTAGDGIAITDGVISTTAKLPAGGEVQAKLTAGKYINIDENNVITTTLKESDSIKIGEDGTITASVPLKEYTGGNGIDVAADGTITTKLLSSNSEQLNINYDESGNAVFTLNVPGLDGNTQYTAGAGLNLDGNEFRLSATESGMFLYTYNADTKQGSWQQVEIVDETAVDTSAEATN